MNSYNAHSSLCAKCYFNYILPRDFVVTVHKLIMVLCDKVFVSAGEVICTGNINLSSLHTALDTTVVLYADFISGLSHVCTFYCKQQKTEQGLRTKQLTCT